ncbi:BolA-like protein 3 [Metarhizium anisopliae]|nr:BolA-like protein 3 [Metarhizium anisopliae]
MIRQPWRAASRRLLLLPPQPTPSPSTRPRFRFSSSTATAASQEQPSMTPAESAIADLLRAKLQPTELLVRDVSGGCGSMYAIDIASPAFKGATMLKQQRMVNAALGDVMRAWHGVQLNTRVSE